MGSPCVPSQAKLRQVRLKTAERDAAVAEEQRLIGRLAQVQVGIASEQRLLADPDSERPGQSSSLTIIIYHISKNRNLIAPVLSLLETATHTHIKHT